MRATAQGPTYVGCASPTEIIPRTGRLPPLLWYPVATMILRRSLGGTSILFAAVSRIPAREMRTKINSTGGREKTLTQVSPSAQSASATVVPGLGVFHNQPGREELFGANRLKVES